jgi:hypothetical protein
LVRLVGVRTLARRLDALEAASGGNRGCERCRGLLVTVVSATTGEFRSAAWNGEAIFEEEATERRTEARCPRCGRKPDPSEVPVIRLRYGA